MKPSARKSAFARSGLGAKEMLGRTPGNIEAIRPLKDGVIADYRIAEQMLNHFIRKVHGSRFFTPGPRIVICVPISSTPVDRRTIRESALAAGAHKGLPDRGADGRRHRL